MTTESKKRMGYLLVQIQHGISWAGVSPQDRETLEILEFHELIEPDPAAVQQGVCKITGKGRELLLNNDRAIVVQGQFLLPGELPWYETFPWKLLFPAIISFVVAVATAAVTTQFFKSDTSPRTTVTK